jgi:hypothetical protein
MPAVALPSRLEVSPPFAPNRANANGTASSAAPIAFNIQRCISKPRFTCRRASPLFLFVVEIALHLILDPGAIHAFYKHVRIQEPSGTYEYNDAAHTPERSARTVRHHKLFAAFFHCHAVLLVLEAE